LIFTIVTCPVVQFACLRRFALWICIFRSSHVFPLRALAAREPGGSGDRMPRYISQHTLACLTRQGAEELSRRLLDAKPVTARRVVFNMQDGKMLAEFEAAGREELEKWLAGERFHFDWLLRIELEAASDGSLQPLP
jgi:hypothetical protein